MRPEVLLYSAHLGQRRLDPGRQILGLGGNVAVGRRKSPGVVATSATIAPSGGYKHNTIAYYKVDNNTVIF